MPYAQIVVGLPLEGPFDYEIPVQAVCSAVGRRALVSFGAKNLIGYIVGVSEQPLITGKGIKPVRRLIDTAAVLDRVLLELTRQVARYYCCSWGITIESALPAVMRTSRSELSAVMPPQVSAGRAHPAITVVHDPGSEERWAVYARTIRACLDAGRSVLFLAPDFESVGHACAMLKDREGLPFTVLHRGDPNEARVWDQLRQGTHLVVSTRSGVFAPCRNLGAIIIDEEQNDGYKQEQPPHYHCRIVALMRRRIERCEVVLGSVFPSLEAYYLTRLAKARYIRLGRATAHPHVRLIDMRAEYSRIGRTAGVVTQYLRDRIAAALDRKARILLFMNRLGFSTLAVCKNCGFVLTCGRCSSNLVYHYRRSALSCRHCSFSMKPPQVCPQCSTGYIQYKGTGTERIESELYRMFPGAAVDRVESGRDLSRVRPDADIYVATSLIMKIPGIRFEMTAVLSLDDTLNRVDFRGGEKACAALSGLAALTDGELCIQTYFPRHRCFGAIAGNDPVFFYEQELAERRQLGLVPFRHEVLLKVRGAREHRVREAGEDIAARIRSQAQQGRLPLELIGVYPGRPPKLRGKFHWQVVVRTASVTAACSFVRDIVRSTPRSGIIVAVDVDPL